MHYIYLTNVYYLSYHPIYFFLCGLMIFTFKQHNLDIHVCWISADLLESNMTYLLDDAALIANLALTHSGIKGDIISLLLKISLIQAPLLKPRVNRRSRPLVWHTDVLWELIYEQRWKYAQFDSVESLPPCHSFIQRCCLPTCFHPLLSC